MLLCPLCNKKAIKYSASTCDGNASGGTVQWNWDAETGLGYYGMQSKTGASTWRVFTRYPQ